MRNTIIFDLDGTLLNSLDDLVDSVNYTLTKYNLPVQSTTNIKAFLGNGMEKLIELSIPDGKKNKNFSNILQEFKDYYKDHSSIKTAPYPNIIELLINLKSKGYKLAIVSNKGDFAVKILNEKFFKGLIDVAIGETKNIRRKPYPDMVNEALKYLNEDTSNAYYVGDSEVDIATGLKANIPCISVSWGFRSKQELIKAGAKFTVDNVCELEEYLKKE